MSDDVLKGARGVRGRRPNRGGVGNVLDKAGRGGARGAESFAYKICIKIAMEKSKISHISANFYQILNA